ncbi:MAG TPA: isochorismatase family protein [Solirubrobacteraceae bacterium]|nr:isochorismatase family protein [Solirubrobacteraceae bacterium]
MSHGRGASTDLSNRTVRDRGVDAMTICGLATDVSVRHTALEARLEGFAVTLDEQGSRGLDPRHIGRTYAELRERGGHVA